MTAKIPMKRTGTLEEVATMAAWIVSPHCSFTTAFTSDLSRQGCVLTRRGKRVAPGW